ncbi:uncharacterized protein LOC101852224 [Aplysia californica]|uniref:Uncharacterized protein LOC101852224 n=1 Tax=Aplysia californica TaxID=6500 RepID=A0ABM0JE98_APLCA|nr:uncharacterized protein LOC101852224 [Aplysia californica]XP_005091725.1 uncharacterized protein LOC101852224 [Aplysia californica]XP_035829725.1 uncharacterized protein LOC101852224 [Aplysia californica]
MSRYGAGGKYNYRDLEQFRDQGQWKTVPQYGARRWDPPLGNGVYLFIRFPGHSAEFAAQTVVLGKRCILSYRGEFVGIARKIHNLSSGPRQEESLVMYLFESTFGAERFFVSDGRFKQHDFPPPAGACEAWTTVKYLDTKDEEFRDFQTYMLCYTTLNGCSFHQYRDEVNQPLGALIEQYGGMPFVVQNVGVNSLRRHHIDDQTMVTLHFFKSEDDVKSLMMDARYDEIKRKQLLLAQDVTSVFTIDHDACP